MKDLPQSSKMRTPRTAILHLAPDLEPDTPGRDTVALAILTQRSGWRALIASSGGRLVNEAERAAVRHRFAPLSGKASFAAWRSYLTLKTFVKRERPALLHAHGLAVFSLAVKICRESRLPLVADLTEAIQDTPRARRLLDGLKTVDAFVRVPSSFLQDYLVSQFGMSRDTIVVVPTGVDLQWYSAGFISPERLQNLSQLWRLPENASVILMPMPLLPNLGHALILEAMSALKDENVFAVLAGDDRRSPGLRHELEQLIEQFNLGGKVIMPEFCHDLPAACWLSSVVVAPNLDARGQNFEVLAAQAIGRPVIVSNVGANPELVLNGETGWVVEPGDVGALADTLRQAIRLTTNERLDIAEYTHNFVAETFPQEVWFNGMLEVYESLLHPSERSARPREAA